MKPLKEHRKYITVEDLGKIGTVTAYSRVSTQEQTKGKSISAQIEFLENWAKREGWDLYRPNGSDQYYCDPGFSGKDIDRPGIQELLQDAETRKDHKRRFDAVLVYHNDRLSRDVTDTLYITDELQRQRIRLLLGNLPTVDLWTPEGRMVLTSMAGMSEYVRRDIGRKTSFGMQKKSSEGEWCGRPPYGFKILQNDQGPGELIPEEEEFKVLKEIAKLRRGKLAYNKIATRLNDKGYLRRKGALWYSGSVQRSFRYYKMWMKEQRSQKKN